MNTVLVPAHLSSTRFPRKLLAEVRGKTCLRWVLEAALANNRGHQLVVCTDAPEIAEAVAPLNVPIFHNRGQHENGTSRCAEYIKAHSVSGNLIVLQADCILIRPETIDRMFDALDAMHFDIVTPVVSLPPLAADWQETFSDARFVKAKRASDGTIVSFDRSALGGEGIHVGAYGLSAELLSAYDRLPPSTTGEALSLEQYKWLDAGHRIGAVEATNLGEAFALNVPADTALIELVLAGAGPQA